MTGIVEWKDGQIKLWCLLKTAAHMNEKKVWPEWNQPGRKLVEEKGKWYNYLEMCSQQADVIQTRSPELVNYDYSTFSTNT